MSDIEARVWLRHGETGGAFHCPIAAVEEWLKLGWRRGAPPQEVNPVTAEMPKPPEAPAAAVETSPESSPAPGASVEGSD